nr:immunoglobulin light chain junction region [Macaca mulatta]MOW30872.1 immunoglobulin light chain junction region [Macaca mulatta]
DYYCTSYTDSITWLF